MKNSPFASALPSQTHGISIQRSLVLRQCSWHRHHIISCCVLVQNKNFFFFSIPRISSRGTGSTFDLSQHQFHSSRHQKELFAINMHCKKTNKTTTFLKKPFYCILHLSLFYSSAELRL